MTEQVTAAAVPAQKTYTLEEVSKHTTEKDCWMVIHGKVLDIAEFLVMHPGGVSLHAQHPITLTLTCLFV